MVQEEVLSSVTAAVCWFPLSAAALVLAHSRTSPVGIFQHACVELTSRTRTRTLASSDLDPNV